MVRGRYAIRASTAGAPTIEMRVLLLGPYPPPHGGVQTNLVAIRQYLLKRQIPCEVINLTRFRKPAGEGVYYPKTALELVTLLLRLPYDIVHLHLGGNLTPRLVALALVCSLLPRRKAMLTFHSGGYPSSPQGRTAGRWTLRGLVFRRLDGVIAVNPEIEALFRKFGVAPERLRLIYPHAPADPEPGTELPPPLAAFFQAHSPLLLTVSGLEPEYDIPLQIEVLGRLRGRFPRAGLAILGAGSLEQELRRQIAARPYAGDILLCGDVPHALTLRAIAASDLLLRTTLYDGDSIAVREGLYLGTPVIATDNGMRPAGVRLFPAGDPDALRAAIEAELGGQARGEKPADSGEQNLEAVLQFYRELLPER